MIYKIAEGVSLVMTETGAYIEKDGERYVIGGAAIQFFGLIDGKRDMDEMLEELVRIYGPDVEPYIIARDLERFMADMASNGLVTLVSSFYDDMKKKN